MGKNLENIRHSLAHLLASAFLKIDPQAKLGIGPTTEDGFYYDFLTSIKIKEEDLTKLEEIMRDLIRQNLKFVGKKVSFEQARKIFKNQPFKLELINDLKKYGTTEFSEILKIKNKEAKPKKIKKVTIYQTGEFIDLCRGGHVKTTKEINPDAFKLTKIAGAYWRGNEKGPMLLRIYGVAFESKEKLEEYLKTQEEAEKYNHRVLGEKLKIFIVSENVGKGLPLILPRGEIIINLLREYMRKKELEYGYLYVQTPVLASPKLYELSGHLRYYAEDMYKVVTPEKEEFYLKPMNCPHHHIIFQKLVRSYKDLPLRLAEPGLVHRYERSGVLYGLMRVRCFVQNDAHIYLEEKDLEDEFIKVINLFEEVFKNFPMFEYWFRLSLPDFKGKNKEKFGGDLKLWQWSSKLIERICKKLKINYVKGIGEAAFYGPKLDIQIKNIYGKEETLATVQIDILVPKRMNLTYVDKNNREKNPIIIHRAILGSYERFLGFLLEKTKGDLPLWLSPIQVVILPISDKNLDYAQKILQMIKEKNFRAEIWSEESLSKRILFAEEEKIPIMVIVGEKEEKNNTISLRIKKEGDLGEKTIDYLLKILDEKGNIPN